MKPPKISVLVPTYNYAEFLPEAVESVLAQDWDDFEVLIADDASTDDSEAVISRLAAADTRIRSHRHKHNLGMVANWNWCLQNSQGEYIKFLFGDDKLVTRHALRTLLSLLDNNPGAVLAASARQVIGPKSELLEVWDEFRKPGLQRGPETIARCMETGVNLIGEPSAVLFRKEDATRGFNLTYRQIVDLEMWFSLLELGDLAYVPEPLCAFRKHDRQQTAVNRSSGVQVEEAARLVWEWREKPCLKPFGVPHLLFRQAYRLGKSRKQCLAGLQLEQEIRRELGTIGFASCWLQYKVTRPWTNLKRTLGKRRGPQVSF